MSNNQVNKQKIPLMSLKGRNTTKCQVLINKKTHYDFR